MDIARALLTNPLDDLLGYQLRRASAALMGELARELDRIGLKATEASVLILIDANPGITQSEIGRALNIKRANMAPLAAMLDLRGFISRQKADGRSQGLIVTTVGADHCRRAQEAMRRHDIRIRDALPKGLAAKLQSALPALWQMSSEQEPAA